MFGERLIIANATGCSSIWGGSAPSNPYTTNEDGYGPAWANSLFEDNAQFGLGIAMATVQRRKTLHRHVAEVLCTPEPSPSSASSATPASATTTAGSGAAASVAVTPALRAALSAWHASWQCPEKANPAAKEVIGLLTVAHNAGTLEHPSLQAVWSQRDMLLKPSIWIIGGDGWAYDIGFGGLDHVLASGEDVNILVLDTEMYSNTGGQKSKSTPLGAVTKFAAGGKTRPKKDLGAIAMGYGDVYVASCCLASNYGQVIKAMSEAEKHDGVSIILGYAPCAMHGIKVRRMCVTLLPLLFVVREACSHVCSRACCAGCGAHVCCSSIFCTPSLPATRAASAPMLMLTQNVQNADSTCPPGAPELLLCICPHLFLLLACMFLAGWHVQCPRGGQDCHRHRLLASVPLQPSCDRRRIPPPLHTGCQEAQGRS